MAPGLVEPSQSAPAATYAKGSTGPKEAFIGGPQAYNETAEEKGTEKQPPATHPSYLPVWDAETKYTQLSEQYTACTSLTSIQDILL